VGRATRSDSPHPDCDRRTGAVRRGGPDSGKPARLAQNPADGGLPDDSLPAATTDRVRIYPAGCAMVRVELQRGNQLEVAQSGGGMVAQPGDQNPGELG